MSIPIFQVDSFTAAPFHGNPAGVCLLTDRPGDTWMQAVAAEMNLSETAFVAHDDGGYWIRYFTPTVEVPLCGHATLASAHVLWQERRVDPSEPIRFFSPVGELRCERQADWIHMDLPADPATPAPIPPTLAVVLGSRPVSTHRSPSGQFLVELDSEDTIRELDPDIPALAGLRLDSVIVTARSSEEGVDFVSRFFAPEWGIDEDPVTGAAHCTLAPFWAERLGKETMDARQLSRRGGELRVQVSGDRVEVSGQTVTVLKGELLVEP